MIEGDKDTTSLNVEGQGAEGSKDSVSSCNSNCQPVNKRTVFRGVVWSAFEQYSSQGVQFIVSVVMARLLTPKEYGIVGIIGVFIGFSSMFIDSGLGSALIRKQNASQADFSTVNLTNIGVSIVMYLALFITAPVIANFYEMPILVPTIRVMAVTFVIGAVSGVGRAILSKKLMFKKLAYITLSTSLFSGCIGILMAYNGFGVWALVLQSVGSVFFSSIWILMISGFRPSLNFSKSSFKELFGFGSKLLASNLLYSLTNNLYQLLIGKFFSAQSLGYYGRANSYSGLIPLNISGVLEKVLYPVLSIIQNDDVRFNSVYNRIISVMSFYIFPGCFFLMGLAHPLILNMISDKWLPCVPILQILCISNMMNHINSINAKYLLTKGYSGVFLKMQLINKPISIAFFLLSLIGGLEGVAWGQVATMVWGTFINYYFLKKKIPIICLSESLFNMLKMLIVAAIAGLVGLIGFSGFIEPTLCNMAIVLIIMALIYFVGTKILAPSVVREAISVCKK